MKEYKYRNEIKFKISEGEAKALIQRLSTVLDKDKNAYYNDGSYLIKSLYFDDIESTSYYEKLDGVLYRKKYRIRIYNNDSTFIKLEKKMKHNNMTAKESQLISKEIYSKILNGNIDGISYESGSLLEEFIANYKCKLLVPSVLVAYQRIAFVYPVSDVRITFDFNIKSGLYNYDLFDEENALYSVNEKGKVVLEVKYNEILPYHIACILESVSNYREATSKFAICRSIK